MQFPDVWRGLTDPIHSWTGPSQTMVANSSIVAVHLYHVLAFKLSTAEIVHHAVFVIILCGLGIAFKQQGGIANNFGCFFLSGLPGGIDYLLLVLVKQELISKMAEKRLNATINTWLRGPSMSVYAFIAWSAWWHGQTEHIHPFWVFVVAFLHFVNGQWYAAEAIAGHAKWQTLTAASAESTLTSKARGDAESKQPTKLSAAAVLSACVPDTMQPDHYPKKTK